ncbi:MAG: thioredoxin domain-containing protein, partial [Terriglobales bacterium]
SETPLGVLATPRKPFQDSPTPAGNPVAAIALFRLYNYTNDRGHRQYAEQTMELFGGVAGRYGIFAATYAIAGVYFLEPHIQIVVFGDDAKAKELRRTAVQPFHFGKAVIKLGVTKAVPLNLPPALSETISQFSALRDGSSVALVCSNLKCRPPISDPRELAQVCKLGCSE